MFENNLRYNQKHLKCIGASLFLQIILLMLTTSVPEGAGGSDEGDPAPGRSPGPPRQSYETSKEAIDVALGNVKANSNGVFWCKKYFAPTTQSHLNVTLFNPLFGAFTKLLPGLLYHVLVQGNSEKEQIEELYASAKSNEASFGTWKNVTSMKLCFGGNWALVNMKEGSLWSFHKSESHNITFRFRYRLSSGNLHEEAFHYSTTPDCSLRLREMKGSLSSGDLPGHHNCRITFPRKQTESSSGHKEGLLIELTRLNVPCTGGGFIQFVEDTNDVEDVASPRKKLCGKLEELNVIERKLYFPSLSEAKRPFLLVHKNPIFSLNYHLVDYCYNVTFVSRNGSLVLNPVKNLLCHFRVHLPYGNRVLLRLQMGDDKLVSTAQTYSEKAQDVGGNESTGELKSFEGTGKTWQEKDSETCDGLFIVIWDGSLTWNHCSRHGDPKRDVQVWSHKNVVTITIAARVSESTDASGYPVVKFWYHAEPVTEVVGGCEFGEVLVKQFCVSSLHVRMDWDEAEQFCGKRGGHLVSIRDEASQNIIDNHLINSPDYKEHNSYWIGASDKIYEGYFRWSDGFAFSYSNWFPGWAQQGFYNRQPNDDGFSHQDCVEIRRNFPHPSGSCIIDGITASFLWNDLDCGAKNYFLCERLETGESTEQSWNQECNKTILLSREHPKATVVSSGFPHQYPDNTRCETLVVAPPGFGLVIDFEELVLEKEPLCSYDYLELVEETSNGSYKAKRFCGDMSDKLKLLRYVSQNPRLRFVFVSDYSNHFGGFKARVSIESGVECSDERYEMFNNSCYLFVGYPKVTWETASQICKGMKAELASVQSPEEESFITGNIRNSIEYTTSSAYWLGGHQQGSGNWRWVDESRMEYTGWPTVEDGELFLKGEENSCLAIQWVSLKTETGHPSSGLYWTPRGCKEIGGYVCKKGNQVSGVMLHLNRTLNGTEGHLMSPGYPGPYYNNLDYYVHVVGPVLTRIVMVFSKVDLEMQTDCLYDFIELKSGGVEEAQVRWCGNRASKKNRSIFVSNNNEAVLRFHSDYSISSVGFFANWKAVDVTGCPLQKLTAREGIIASPNYGDFLLPDLDCTTIIIAPPGKRIWIEFTEVDIKDEARQKSESLEVKLGDAIQGVQLYQSDDLSGGNFISIAEKLVLRLKTTANPKGIGFRAVYRTVSALEEEQILNLTPETVGILHHLNYPADPPAHVNFVQHLVAPVGYVIYLELHDVTLTEMSTTCPDGSGIIEIVDNYADENGTRWFLCELNGDPLLNTPPLAITSYLNTLHVRQRSSSIGAHMNATVKTKADPSFKDKLLRTSEDGAVESCRPNPCRNGGKCVNSSAKRVCQCIGHFTGMFCALTLCDLEPCVFGQCELTGNGYRCHCRAGYTGPSCERKQSPCEDNPCEGRGECVEKSDSFYCRCHAWWEGPRCERRMMHIPFKPLSERMLHEPFWLGLITVFVVLGIIGLVWCAKRHFPEKLEKLLAEEADRNGRFNVSGIIRPPSVREQINASSGAVTVTNHSGAANCPRTLFGRLGIRKSSLLSLTSPQHPDTATSRTFSLDDLLRPPPRRTPSPRKKSSSSSQPKRNASEKKQILQQLICSATTPTSCEKFSLQEPVALKEPKKRKSFSCSTEKSNWQETSFSSGPSLKIDAKNDFNKLEKKVTFARLLSKVSAEMSSGSDAEAMLNLTAVKALSTPVSPASERKPRLSTSSNAGSESLSSSEIAISGSTLNSMFDIPADAKRPSRLAYRGSKNISADSILDMFRNFTSTSVTTRSKGITPSSTPTASSPQDEFINSDESSFVETPASTTSGPIDSPTSKSIYGTTIEIPVMDALTAHKTAHASSANNFLQPPSILLEIPTGNNKFLSPIREVPTPTPSPALTPIMSRTDHKTSNADLSESSDDDGERKSGKKETDGDNFSEIHIQVHREDDNELSKTDEEYIRQNFPMKNEENAQAMVGKTVGERRGMIIPLLTVQEPSPPSMSPPGSFPGSPPPHKDMEPFMYSPVGTPRRMNKSPTKPNSLDLPYPPPMITITCNVSEPESDTESISAVPKNPNLRSLNPTVNSVGMTYLSPFSMCSRADRTASESNLSSSGYSSMTSPGPSRCGSNNPLCLSEVEDHQPSRSQPSSCHLSPVSRTPTKSEPPPLDEMKLRGRSDSETLSDDPLLESNDEGIGTDHLDEKAEEREGKTTRDLEIFLGKEANGQTMIDFSSLLVPATAQRGSLKKWDNSDSINSLGSAVAKASLQLPTIVVQSDCCDKLLSPVSSRSESPLSDKALGLGRFSPMFYCKSKCDNLPFTDSDGLYDFPSSDCHPCNNKSVQAGTTSHRKSTGRRRERRNSYRMTNSGSKTSSPTKGQNCLLEVPQKNAPGHRITTQRKPSPKRRVRTQQPLSSSSSTESLTSSVSSSAKTKDEETRRMRTECSEKQHGSNEASAEDTTEECCKPTHDSSCHEPVPRRRTIGFRTIGHQIRFLRRIELSLSRKEKLVSCVDSDDDEDADDPSASLLPRELRKSPSIGIVSQSGASRRRESKSRVISGLSQRCPEKQEGLSMFQQQAD